MEDNFKNKSAAPDFNLLEEEILKYWETQRIPERHLKLNEGKEPYVFYDGPPFATGLPHYGHILASVIKDAIPRYQVMKGKFVRRRWGWDCHGLPIENIVEKHLKISGKKQIEEIGVERFNRICRDNVLQYAHEWGKMVTRAARWVEYENSYKTMDSSYMESVWWALKQIWEKGLIYEDRKVLLYCSRCETPISNFEVAMDNSYRTITEESVYVKFKLLPRQRIVDNLTNENTYVLAWTTTPWTLPGHTSLSVGDDIRYTLVEQNGERYIVAQERINVIEGPYEVIAEFSARSLEGLAYEPPFPGIIADPNGKAHHIYIDDFVTVEDGTGVVHSAVMHGEDDFLAAKKHGLPQVSTLDHKGQYLDIVPEFLRGLFFKDAEKAIIKYLEEKKLLYKSEDYTHSYPHCYRCATPLYYSALPAWFINIQKIKPRLLELNESINWYPDHLKHGRFGKSVAGAPDWNISRNRFWATALPFWKCQADACGNVVCIGSVNELREKSINFYEVYPAAESGIRNQESGNADTSVPNSKFIIPNSILDELDLHKPYIDQVILKCDKCSSKMHRVPEVVDCWVESGSMPFAELHYPFENKELFASRFPADFVAEYIAQTRAWFYVTHVISTLINDAVPFRHVVTTGNIMAEDGNKMSKSLRNFPDPWLLIHKYGVDALRFYLLTSPVMNGDDINFSEKSVTEVHRKVSLILYNVLGFYSMYSAGPSVLERPNSSHIMDQWILSRLLDLQKKVTEYLDGYNTVKAGREMIDFVNDLSTWHVRRSRERIKEGGVSSKDALDTLGYVLVETAKVFAPFMPFLSEYIYRKVRGGESVHFESWSQNKETPNKHLLDHMNLLRQIVELGLSLRKDAGLRVRQPLGTLQYQIKEAGFTFSSEMEKILAEELNVKTVEASEVMEKTASFIVKEGSFAKVALDTAITPELAKEGNARELERNIQDLRKKSGLKVGEMVDLYYNTEDEELADILIRLVDRKKTFVNKVETSLEVEADFESQVKIAEKPIWLGLVKL